MDYSQKLQIMVKNCGSQSKTMDFAVSDFKTTKFFISFQSRERIQRVSMFFSFFNFRLPTSEQVLTPLFVQVAQSGEHLLRSGQPQV